jgi:hypothetical protein
MSIVGVFWQGKYEACFCFPVVIWNYWAFAIQLISKSINIKILITTMQYPVRDWLQAGRQDDRTRCRTEEICLYILWGLLIFRTWWTPRFLFPGGKPHVCKCEGSFLGAFAKLWNATFSFGMFVLPSTHPSARPLAWNKSAPIGRIFMQFDTWLFFKNLSRNFKFHSNLTNIKVRDKNTSEHLWSYIVHFFLEWVTLQTKDIEKIKTHFNNNNFFFENSVVYEIIWENI